MGEYSYFCYSVAYTCSRLRHYPYSDIDSYMMKSLLLHIADMGNWMLFIIVHRSRSILHKEHFTGCPKAS